VTGPLLDGAGAVVEPVIAVDLDRPGALGDQAASGRILVGVTTRPAPPLASALDLTLSTDPHPGRAAVHVEDPATALAELTAAVTANPQAALLLSSLLRWTGDLPVERALEAESLAYSTLLGGPEFARWLARRGSRPPPPPAAAPPVLLDRDDTRLTITLNRPERRNAYGHELRDALIVGLELAAADGSIERVVLRGAGPVFSSGGDLDEFGTTPDPVTAHLIRTRAGAARLLHALGDRTEAQVHGSCVGAGIELPAFAGRLTAAADTTFRLPELGMGLIPGAGGTVSIPRRIGRWRTAYLALTGAPLDAGTAVEWGLVDVISTPHRRPAAPPP
jgi:enoyl-CoA hydratase/carnithine racemase